MKRSQNEQSFLNELRRDNCVTIICDSICDVNDKNTCSSWLMYYLI